MKMQKSIIFVKKNLKINILKIKNISKIGIIVIMHGYSVPKEIPIIFYNGSSYDDNFVIKKLEKDFFCLVRRKY